MTYADDDVADSGHLHLEPTREKRAQKRWMRSVQVAVISRAPFWIGRTSLALGGTYDAYRFSDIAPDRRLVPAAAPASAPP